jgi:hypothetical protein
MIEMTEVFGWTQAGDVTRAHRPLCRRGETTRGRGLSTPAQPLRSRHLIGTRRYAWPLCKLAIGCFRVDARGAMRQIARSDAPA